MGVLGLFGGEMVLLDGVGNWIVDGCA